MENNDIVPEVDRLHVLKGLRALDRCRRYEQQLKHPLCPFHLVLERLMRTPPDLLKNGSPLHIHKI